MASTPAIVGAKYKLQEPNWTKTIGQGNPPAALNLNGNLIPWNSPVICDDQCAYPCEKLSGEWHVRVEVIDEMNQNVRQFYKLPS